MNSQPINQKHGQSIFSAGCIFISPLFGRGAFKVGGRVGRGFAPSASKAFEAASTRLRRFLWATGQSYVHWE